MTGGQSILEIVEAARANGIDFVMLTDHDWLQAKHDGYETILRRRPSLHRH